MACEDCWFPAMDVVQDDNYATVRHRDFRPVGLDLEQPIILFTQHSVTTEFSKSGEQVKPSLEALKSLADSGVRKILQPILTMTREAI